MTPTPPKPAPPKPEDIDRTEAAARRAGDRAKAALQDPEPSLARRFGQIGVLGWTIVLPTLAGLGLGHWIDRALGTGIIVSAALLMVGAGTGLWLAFRWMHAQ